jgi:peptidoglycan/LPS O-acetylase OafA/YrhL
VRFAIVRFARFFPLIALGVSLGALVGFAKVSGPGLLLNLLILPAISEGSTRLFLFNPPEWSLFYELIINLFYGAMILHLTSKRLAVLMAVAFVVLAGGALSQGTLNLGWQPWAVPFGIARVTYSFFAGVLLYRMRHRLPPLKSWNLSAAILVLTVLPFVLPIPSLVRPAMDSLFVLVGAPTLVWLGSLHEPHQSHRPVVTMLGTLSYPLYAIHYPICFLLARYAGHGWAAACAALAGGAVTLGLASSAAERFYDKPLRKVIAGGLRRPQYAVEASS